MNVWLGVAGIVVTVMLALLGYARIWGYIQQRLEDVTKKADETAQMVRENAIATSKDIKEINAKMLTQSDLNLAIANVRIEILRETMQRERERRDGGA